MGQRCSISGTAAATGVPGRRPAGMCAAMCRGDANRLGCPVGVDDQEATIGSIFGPDVDGKGGGIHGVDRSALAELAALSPTQTAHVQNMTVPHGGSFTGQVRGDGQPEGEGTQRWPDGTVFTGCWSAGAAHGRGKLSKPDGSGYEGQWVEGRKDGQGFECLVDQSEYTGEFADGQKHGMGSFRWHGGASYTGDFCEDALHGVGTFTWDDGRRYRGQWVLGRMQGQGRFEWPDGRVFEGKYEADKKHGPGIFSWSDGSKCVGVWVQGKQHGLGVHISIKGMARKGRWHHGSLEDWLEAPPMEKPVDPDVDLEVIGFPMDPADQLEHRDVTHPTIVVI